MSSFMLSLKISQSPVEMDWNLRSGHQPSPTARCATKPFTAHGSSRCCRDSAPAQPWPWSVQRCPKLKYDLSVKKTWTHNCLMLRDFLRDCIETLKKLGTTWQHSPSIPLTSQDLKKLPVLNQTNQPSCTAPAGSAIPHGAHQTGFCASKLQSPARLFLDQIKLRFARVPGKGMQSKMPPPSVAVSVAHGNAATNGPQPAVASCHRFRWVFGCSPKASQDTPGELLTKLVHFR